MKGPPVRTAGRLCRGAVDYLYPGKEKSMMPALQLRTACVGVLMGLSLGTAAPRAGGPLRVHPDNPRYFTDGSGKAVYLTGSHTWNNFQHNGVYPRVEYREYLDFLAKHNHNFIRLWVWEQGGWDPWAAGHVSVEPVAYLRTGPGNALDGKPKYDLTKFNDEYFERLRSRVVAAQKRGIYVSVMLFQGWSVEKKGQVGNPWQGHPFHRANNINGIDGDPSGDGQGPEIHTQKAPPEILELQKAYVCRVIDTVNDVDNVLYEIGNEMHGGSVLWQYRMIEFIHEYERTKPRQHPVGMTGAPIANAALLDSPADWIAPTGRDGYNADPPPASGRKVIISDVDHVWPKQYRHWIWKSFTRGLNTAFMDLYGATRIGDKDATTFGFVGDWLAQHDTVRKNLGYTRTLAERMNLAAMTPRGDLASSGYCLADPGREYVVYLPQDGEATVDLSAVSGPVTVEWLDPRSGDTTRGQSTSGSQKRVFQPPFPGDAVLYLRSVGPQGDTSTGKASASSGLARAARGVEMHRKGDATVRLVRTDGADVSGVQVAVAQRTHDFAFGNVFRPRHYTNEAYRARFLELFNFIQLLEFNWGQYETEEGRPKLAARREFLDGWCRDHGLTRFYGHMLVWSPQNDSPDRPNIPHWLFRYDRPTQDRLLQERIQREVLAYRDVDILWDVVNEAVHCRRWGDWGKKGYMDEPLSDVVPYVRDAFRWAHAANPQARLLLNDYRVIPPGRYRDRYIELIDRLRKEDTPVHAIGIQAHDPDKGAYWFSPEEVWQTCEQFGTRTGLPVHFTEFCYLSDPAQDIRGTHRRGKWDPQKQADAIEEFYRVAFGHPAVASITYFGMGDDDPPWLPNLCLLDKSFHPKPAWDRLKKLIKEEWNTRESGATDATGVYHFRGFFGQYDVSVTDAGKRQTFTSHLEKGKPNVWSFTLDR